MARTKAAAKGKSSPKATGNKGLAKKASAKKGRKAAPKPSPPKVMERSSSEASSSAEESGRSRSRSEASSRSRSEASSRSKSRSSSRTPSPVKAKGKAKGRKPAESPKTKGKITASPKAKGKAKGRKPAGSPKEAKVPSVLEFHEKGKGKAKIQYAQIGKVFILNPKLSCYKQAYKDEAKDPREVYKIHGHRCDEDGKAIKGKDGNVLKSLQVVLSPDNLAIANANGLECEPKEIKPYQPRKAKEPKRFKGKDPLRGLKLSSKMIRALLRVYIEEHGEDLLDDNVEGIRKEFATKKRVE